jgi:hypothetical protein
MRIIVLIHIVRIRLLILIWIIGNGFALERFDEHEREFAGPVLLHNARKEYAEGTDTEYDMNNAENYAVCMVEQIRSEMKRVEKTWN